MILNLLKIVCVAFGVMVAVLALGYLYVMNEMREELKKDRGLFNSSPKHEQKLKKVEKRY